MKLTKELAKLMKDYNASDLDELMDILPDLDFEEEDELPLLPQQEVTYKEPAVPKDENVTYPFSPYPFNN